MILGIRLDDFKRYLCANDWATVSYDRKFMTIQKRFDFHEEYVQLLIPNDESLVDYTHRINDIIYSIAILEEKEVKDIIKEMLKIKFEKIRNEDKQDNK